MFEIARKYICFTSLGYQKPYSGLWWNRIKLPLYEGYESEHSPRTCSIGRPVGDTLCLRPIPLHYGVVGRMKRIIVLFSLFKNIT